MWRNPTGNEEPIRNPVRETQFRALRMRGVLHSARGCSNQICPRAFRGVREGADSQIAASDEVVKWTTGQPGGKRHGQCDAD